VQVVSSLQGGIVDMSVMNASLLNGVSKEFSFLDFPFLFNTNAEAYSIVDGPIGKRLMDKLPAKNLVGLAYPELGFRHISNAKRPINKIEDLQGLKIRVIQTPVYVEMMNALGANATPLPFPEVYGALETKAVDGATNPLVTLQVQKFYEVQKYLTLTRHQYNPKTWDSLPPADQKILQDAAIEARDFERKVSREKEALALEYLKKHLQVNELPAAEVARARERLKPVIDKYTKEVGEDLMNDVNAELAKMRGGK
jgi:tripartite ATP-independent transporter DctP family solute receptor